MMGFKELDAAELKAMLDEKKEIQLVDVRTPAEIAKGVIPSAQHMPLHMIPMEINQLSKDKPVVFYCLSGGRSSQASAFAVQSGLSDVFNLRGGITAWQRERFPLVDLP